MACHTSEALLGELDRRVRVTFGIPQAAATALAVIDGAGVPLTPSQVSDWVLIASATMTATLDLLEHRSWIRRVANPDDRRSTLIEITPDGQVATDQLLPGIRTLEKSSPSPRPPSASRAAGRSSTTPARATGAQTQCRGGEHHGDHPDPPARTRRQISCLDRYHWRRDGLGAR